MRTPPAGKTGDVSLGFATLTNDLRLTGSERQPGGTWPSDGMRTIGPNGQRNHAESRLQTTLPHPFRLLADAQARDYNRPRDVKLSLGRVRAAIQGSFNDRRGRHDGQAFSPGGTGNRGPHPRPLWRGSPSGDGGGRHHRAGGGGLRDG